jgi:DNA-binding CsgD family transcriptional regulator
VIEGVRQGSGGVLVIEGEAGIGKSRLLHEVLAQASDLTVLLGHCEESGRVQPFWPLAQALDAVSRGADPLAETLAPLFEASVADPTSTPAAQFRIVQAVESAIETLAIDMPVCLIIEDLHWADVATIVALRSLARRLEQLPVLLVTTLRPGHGTPELHRLTDGLIRGGAEHLRLGPLEDNAVAILAADLVRATPGTWLLSRLQGAAGNPLYVIEYASALLKEGTLAIEDGTAEVAGETMPLGFRDAVLRRLADVTYATAELLRMGSVLGSVFSPNDLATAVGSTVIAAGPQIQEATEAGLLAERGPSLTFAHALVREAVYESIPAPVRKQLHREVAHAFAEAGKPPIAVAHHQDLAADERDEEAAQWLRRAGLDVTTRDPATAVELLKRSRELLGPGDPRKEDVLAELVMPLAWSGRLEQAEEIGRRVINRAPRPSVAGPLRCALVYALAWLGRPQEALQYAETSEELSDYDALLLRAQAAVARMMTFDLKGAGEDAMTAAQGSETKEHDLALATALGVQTFLITFTGDVKKAIETGRRAVAIADESSDGQPHLAAPRFFLGMPLIASDRLEEAEDVLQTGRRIAEELGHVWCLPLYHGFLGTTRFTTGDWDDAVTEFETSLDIADQIGMRMFTFVTVTAWLAVIHVHRGDLEKAENAIASADQRVAEAGPQIGMNLLAWARALLHESRGNTEAALAILQNTWDFAIAAGLQAEPWSGAALARMHARAGQAELALPMAVVFEEQAERNPTPLMKARGLGTKGLATSDPDLLLEAVEMYRQSPRPHELALACEDAATVLARTDRKEEAPQLLEEALSIFETLGAERDAARTRALLRELGVRRGTARAAARPRIGWESLTPTELKVVALVAQRLSNPEVAERLFISRYTVESHLKHIYAKLGLSSRRELAEKTAKRAASPSTK